MRFRNTLKYAATAITLILVNNYALSQTEEQSLIAKFIITDAKNNGIDVTPTLLEAGAYTVFYSVINDDRLHMANVWPNTNSQSFGPMYRIDSKSHGPSYNEPQVDTLYFNWSYVNTYDNESGTAKVRFIKTYKPQGIAFSIKIIPEDLDVIIYKGYMEGTLDLSIYD